MFWSAHISVNKIIVILLHFANSEPNCYIFFLRFHPKYEFIILMLLNRTGMLFFPNMNIDIDWVQVLNMKHLLWILVKCIFPCWFFFDSTKHFSTCKKFIIISKNSWMPWNETSEDWWAGSEWKKLTINSYIFHQQTFQKKIVTFHKKECQFFYYSRLSVWFGCHSNWIWKKVDLRNPIRSWKGNMSVVNKVRISSI